MQYQTTSRRTLPFLICGLLALNSFCILNTRTKSNFSYTKIQIGNLVLSSEFLEVLFFVFKNRSVKKLGRNLINSLDGSFSVGNKRIQPKFLLFAKYIQQFKYYYYRYFSQYQLENCIIYNNKELNIIAVEILFILVEG